MVRILFFSLFLQVSTAQAVLVGNLDENTMDLNRETDVFVVGYAGALGSNFLRTAVTYARKTREQNSERQIIFIVENRESDYTSSKYVKNMGVKLLNFNADTLTAEILTTTLRGFKKIHSLHVVSHSALENGIGLTDETTAGRWNYTTPNLDKIRFTADGYVVLHGCNTGFMQAPEMSAIFGVPVFGSLTATNFQQPFDNGEWYFHDKALYPVGASMLDINTLAFEEPASCASGACLRLKADYFPYNGFWGDFGPGGALSFYKSFCTFGTDEENKASCLNGMRQFMQIFPSHLPLNSNSSFDDYKAVVKDFLCGIHRTKNIRPECYEKLEEAETNPSLKYGGVVGNPLQCDNFGKCDFTFSCDNSSSVHTCTLSAPKNTEPTTIVEEYLHYLEAF